MTLKNIFIGVITTIIVTILTGIWYNTRDVPQLNSKLDNLTEQIGRHDILLDQEMTKTALLQAKCEELEKRLNKLEK